MISLFLTFSLVFCFIFISSNSYEISFPIKIENSDGTSHTIKFQFTPYITNHENVVLSFCEQHLLNHASCKQLLGLVTSKLISLDQNSNAIPSNLYTHNDISNIASTVIQSLLHRDQHRLAMVYLERTHYGDPFLKEVVALSAGDSFDMIIVFCGSVMNINQLQHFLSYDKVAVVPYHVSISDVYSIIQSIAVLLEDIGNGRFYFMLISDRDASKCDQLSSKLRYFLDKMNSSLALLDSDMFDMIGFEYHSRPHPGFIGEFWWSTSRYMSSLSSSQHMPASLFKTGSTRIYQYDIHQSLRCEPSIQLKNEIQATCNAINIVH